MAWESGLHPTATQHPSSEGKRSCSVIFSGGAGDKNLAFLILTGTEQQILSLLVHLLWGATLFLEHGEPSLDRGPCAEGVVPAFEVWSVPALSEPVHM